MRVLTHVFSVCILSLLVPVTHAADETATVALPDTFPGLGGFPQDGGDYDGDSDLPPAYPEWPDRFSRTEIIPLPPPGPYMSSALSDVAAFPADSGGLRDEFRQGQMRSPFFEADMPWPEIPERARPEPWIPENGEYHFVPEEVVRELESPIYDRRPEFPRFQSYPGYPPPPPVRRPYYGYR
jgi:hypothetical protein